MPTTAEDKAITAAAKADPDAQPLTPKQLQAMVPMKAVRGRPKSENKKTDRKFNRMRPSMARVLGLETRSAKEG